MAHSAVESPMSALAVTSLKRSGSSGSRQTTTSTPAPLRGPSAPSSSSSSTSHLTSDFAPLSPASESTYSLASARLSTRFPCPPKAPSSSRKRAGGSSIGALSRGLPSEVQATSGAWVGLYCPVRVRWRMDSRNSARSAISLDSLLPELAEGLPRQRRELPGVRPGARGTGEGPDGVVPDEGPLGYAAHLAGDLEEGRVPHRVLEPLEGERLPLAPHALLHLAVAELEQEVMQRDAHGARLPARTAQRRGVGQVLGLFGSLQQGRYNGPDRTRVRRAVGVATGLAVDRADVQAGAAADAVEGLLELRAEKLRASVVQQDQVELLGPVQLSLTARPGDEVGVAGDLLSRSAPPEELDEDREIFETRDHLLYPHHDHVHRRDARHEPGVALVGDGRDRAGLGHPEVRARYADVRREELLPQPLAGEGAQGLDVGRHLLPRGAGEDLGDAPAVHVEDGAHDVRGGVPGELGDPLPEVCLHDLQVQIRVALLQAVVELYLLGRHALGLGYHLRVLLPRQLPDVPDGVLTIFGEEDLAAPPLDGVGHLLEVTIEVRHRLLLDVVGPLAEVGGLREGVQDGVARRDGFVGEQRDGVVELLVPHRPPAPLVKTFDLADDALAAPILRLALAWGLARLHAYPAFPKLPSSIWISMETSKPPR